MSTIVPMKTDSTTTKSVASGGYIPKILACFFFLTTIGLAITLGVVVSNKETETVIENNVTVLTETQQNTVTNTQTQLVRVENELTFAIGTFRQCLKSLSTFSRFLFYDVLLKNIGTCDT